MINILLRRQLIWVILILNYSPSVYGAVTNTTFENNHGYITELSSVKHNANNNLMVTYYPSGRIKETWDPENQIKRIYYKNGGIRLIEYYKVFKIEILKTFYSSGNVEGIWHYKDGNLYGISKTFYPSGNVKGVWPYKEGRSNGINKKYYDTGKIWIEESYKNDVRHGITREYGKNGKLLYEENFKDAQFDGPFREFYEDGTLKAEGLNRKNKVVSEKQYNEEGVLIFEQKY